MGGERGGLAKKFTTLGELTKLESALKTAIKSSKVPPKETRKLLKSDNPNQVKNTALFQFMQNLFKEIGLGVINIDEKQNFKMFFSIEDNPVVNIYPDVEDKKTCYIIVDAFSDFFTEDLSIPADVKEVKCKNAGDPRCVFKVDLQPLAVYKIALDETDEEIIEEIRSGNEISVISDKLGIMKDELDYRVNVLQSYHVIDEDMDLTKIGLTYYKYGKSVIDEGSEDIEPPWKTMSKISGDIADSTSFAEAISSSVGEEGSEEIKNNEIVNLAQEADKSKSFAQLVSKTVTKKDEEES